MILRSIVGVKLCLFHADRLFWSIQDTWNSVMSLPTDVKELIPEFYSSDHMFLVNGEGVDFGERTSGALDRHAPYALAVLSSSHVR